MIKKKRVVSKLNIIISYCFKNRVGEFYSKKKGKRRNLVLLL